MVLDKGFFRLAYNTSLHSDCRVKVGAVVSRKVPISVGFNVIKTHPRYSNPNTMSSISVHAEMQAILGTWLDIHGCDIYVYRELDDGMPALARPCNMCYNVLKNRGIKKIYYTIDTSPYWKMERL